MAKRDAEIEAVDEELVEAGRSDGRRAAPRRARRKGAEPRGYRGADAHPAAPPRKHRNRRLGPASRADLHRSASPRIMPRAVGLDRSRDRRPAARGNGRPALRDHHRRTCSSRPIRRGPCPSGWCSARSSRSIVLVALMSWLNRRSLEQPDDAATNAPVASTAARRAASSAAPPAGRCSGPVVLTATGRSGCRSPTRAPSLFAGVLAAGQTYTVPATATAPVLKTGKPEALRIKVGTAVAPPVGPAGKPSRTSACLPADLMKWPGRARGADGDSAAPRPPAPRGVPRPAAARRDGPPPAPPAGTGAGSNTDQITGQFIAGARRGRSTLSRRTEAWGNIQVKSRLITASCGWAPHSRSCRRRRRPAPGAASPEQRIDRLERQVQQMQRQVFPKGRPADTAGFADDPAATHPRS